MSKFGEELIESLTDALAHARGEASGVREGAFIAEAARATRSGKGVARPQLPDCQPPSSHGFSGAARQIHEAE
jgi:hypothetical protein